MRKSTDLHVYIPRPKSHGLPDKNVLVRDLLTNSPMFGMLYGRWQDEKQHEDFNDYIKHVQKFFPTCIGGSKRPFSFDFTAQDFIVTIKITSRKVEAFSRRSN